MPLDRQLHAARKPEELSQFARRILRCEFGQDSAWLTWSPGIDADQIKTRTIDVRIVPTRQFGFTISDFPDAKAFYVRQGGDNLHRHGIFSRRDPGHGI